MSNKINDHPQQTNIEVMNDLINCSTRPSCNPNTYLSNKKKRFENWLQVPDTMHQELMYWKEKAKASEISYRNYIEAKECWLNSFDSSRKLLCDKLDNLCRINKKMRMETKTLTSIVLQHASRNSISMAKHDDIGDHDGKDKKKKKLVHSDTHINHHPVDDVVDDYDGGDDDDDDDDGGGGDGNDASHKRKSYLQLSDVIHDAFERRDSINNILSSFINDTTTNHDLKINSKVINDDDDDDDVHGVVMKKITKSKKSKRNKKSKKSKHVVDKHASVTKPHHPHRHHHHVLTIDEMDYYAMDFKYINPSYESNNSYTSAEKKMKMKPSDDNATDGGVDGGFGDNESNSAVLKDSGIEGEERVQVNSDNTNRSSAYNNINNINNNSNDDIKSNDTANRDHNNSGRSSSSSNHIGDDDNHDSKSDGRVDGSSSSSSSSNSNEVFTNDYICDHLQLQYFDAITKEVLPAEKPCTSSTSNSHFMDDHDHHRKSLHTDDDIVEAHDHHANTSQHKGSHSKVIGITVAVNDTTETNDHNRVSHSLRNGDDGDDYNDDNNNRVVIITPQQCIELFSTLHESIRRCETTVGDVDFMFQHDNRLMNDMMLIESIVKDDKIASSLYASTASSATTATSTTTTTNDATVGDSKNTQNNNYQANNIINNSGSGDVVGAPSLSLLPTKSEQQSIVNIYSLLDMKQQQHTSNSNNYWGKFLQLFINSSVNTVEHSSSIITTRKKKKAITIELSQVAANARSRTPRQVPLIISPLSQYEDRYIGNKNRSVSNHSIRHPTINNNNNNNNNSSNNSSSSRSSNDDTELYRCITQAENECIERCFLHTYSAMSDLKIRRLKVIQKDSFKLMQDAMSSVKKMELMYAHALHDSSQENLRIQSDLVYYGIDRSKNEDNDDGDDIHCVDRSNNNNHHHHQAHSQDSVCTTNVYPLIGSAMLEGMNTTTTTHDQSTDDSKKRSLFQSSYGPFTKRRK